MHFIIRYSLFIIQNPELLLKEGYIQKNLQKRKKQRKENNGGNEEKQHKILRFFPGDQNFPPLYLRNGNQEIKI